MSFTVLTADNHQLTFAIWEETPGLHRANRVEIAHSEDGIVGIFDALELLQLISGTRPDVWAVAMSRPFCKLTLAPRGPGECTLAVTDPNQAPDWRADAKYRLSHDTILHVMCQLREVVYRVWEVKVSATAHVSAEVEQALRTLANADGVTVEGLFAPTV